MMNTYGSGFITILLYGNGEGAEQANTLITEAGDDILTELSDPILTET